MPSVLKVVQAPTVPVAPGTAEAASAHCALLLPCIRVLAAQLQTCARQVESLLTALGTVEAPTAPPVRRSDCSVAAWRRAEDYRLAVCGSGPAAG